MLGLYDRYVNEICRNEPSSMGTTYSVLAARLDDNFFVDCDVGCSSRDKQFEVGVLGVRGDRGLGIECLSD